MAGADEFPTRRNSLRYPGYDYRQSGWVFVTICTHRRQRLFRSVRNGGMHLSPQGIVARQYLNDIANRVTDVIVDSVVVTPDHIHTILMTGADPHVQPDASITDIVHDYKIRYQAAWRRYVASGEWPPYTGQFWQRGYYDRIIRNDRELDTIREYILANPARWQERQQT